MESVDTIRLKIIKKLAEIMKLLEEKKEEAEDKDLKFDCDNFKSVFEGIGQDMKEGKL